MFCPLYKNKEVFDGFNEIVQAFGGKPLTAEEFRSSDLRNERTGTDWSAMEAAYKIYNQSGGVFLDKVPNSVSVEFPDGKDSILFKDLLNRFGGDRVKAIRAKSDLFSDRLKKYFVEKSKYTDENGEPTIQLLEKANKSVRAAIFKRDSFTNPFVPSERIPSSLDKLEQEELTSADIVEELFGSESISNYNKPLAAMLASHNIPIRIDNSIGESTIATSITDKDGNSVILINMNLAKKVSPNYFSEVILHEVVHSLTSNAIDKPKTFIEKTFARLNQKLYDMLRKNLNRNRAVFLESDSSLYNALLDPHEFAAEFATNHNTRVEVQRLAKELDNSKGVISRTFIKYVNAISNLLLGKAVVGNQGVVERYKNIVNGYLNNKPTFSKQSNLTTNKLLEEYKNVNQNTLLNETIISLNDQLSKDLNALSVHNKSWKIVRTSELNSKPEISIDATVERVVKSLNTRKDAIKTSNITPGEKSTATNSVESQVALFVTGEISRYMAIGTMIQQVVPQLMEDIKAIQEVKWNNPNPDVGWYRYQLHGNVGAYHKILSSIEQMLQESQNLEQILQEYNRSANDDEKITLDDLIDLRQSVTDAASVANTGVLLLNAIAVRIAANTEKGIAEKVGAYDAYDVANALYDSKKLDDISSRNLFMGASDSSPSPIIRTIAHIVNKAHTSADDEAFKVNVQLRRLEQALSSGESILDIYEYDENGQTTGYMVRDRNFGKFWKNYDKLLFNMNRIINKQFGTTALQDDNALCPEDDTKKTITLSKQQAKQLGLSDDEITLTISPRELWNKVRNNWISKNGERKYINEYYDIQARLPMLARQALNAFDSQIQAILSIPGIIDEKGHRHYDKLTDEQWTQLNKAWEGKNRLYSRFDEFGKLKQGSELEIAESLQKYRDDLNNLRDEQILKMTGKKPDKSTRFQREYDTEAWVAAQDAMIEECGGKDAFNAWFEGKKNHNFDDKKFMKWARRNSRLAFRTDEGHNMWEEIDNLMRAEPIDYGAEHEAIQKQIDDLLFPLKDKYGEVNPNEMSESLKNTINKLQRQKYAIEREAAKKNPDIRKQQEKRKELIEQYYEYVDTEYYKDIKEHLRQMFTDPDTGDLQFEEYYSALIDHLRPTKGAETVEEMKPYSWLQRIEAVNKSKYMEFKPNEGWINRGQETYLINDRFDDSYDSYMIPKKNLYDNSNAYSKIMKSKTLKALYDQIHENIVKSNDMHTNRLYTDDYLLPQIEGSLRSRLHNSDRKWSVAGRWLAEKFGFGKDQAAQIMYGQYETLDETTDEGVQLKKERLYGQFPDGRKFNTLPQYYTRKLKDPSRLSLDLVGIVSDYYRMSARYRNKLNVRDEVETLADVVHDSEFRSGDKVVQGAESKQFRFLDNWLEMNLYDTMRIQKSVKIYGTPYTWCLDKTLNIVKQTATARNLGLSISVAGVGYFTNMLTALTWAITGRRFGMEMIGQSIKSTIWSALKAFVTAPKSMRNPLATDKTQVIMEQFDIAEQGSLIQHDTDRNRLGMYLWQNHIYGIMRRLDWLSKGTIMQSVLRSYRYVDGEFTTDSNLKLHRLEMSEEEYKRKMNAYKSAKSLWDCIDTSTSEITITGGAEYENAYKDVQYEVISRCKKWSAEADGMATDMQRIIAMRSWVGLFVAMHRQYLPLMLDKYYGQRVLDYDTGEYKNGIHRNMFNFVMNLTGANMFTAGLMWGGLGTVFLGSLFGPINMLIAGAVAGIAANQHKRRSNKKAGKKTLGLKESFEQYFGDESSVEAYQESLMNKSQLKESLSTIAMYQVISLIADALALWADSSDDDEWLKNLKYLAVLIARKVQWEYYTPYRTDDLLNNFKSATAATSLSDAVSNAAGGVTGAAISLAHSIFPRSLFDPLEIVDLYNSGSELKTVSSRSKTYGGMPVIERDLIKLHPAHNLLEQLTNAKAKLGYVENQMFHNPRKDSNSLFYTMRRWTTGQPNVPENNKKKKSTNIGL